MDSEQDLNSVTEKLGYLEHEAFGEKGWGSRLEEHEVRLTSIRSKVDSQETQQSELHSRVRGDLDSRLDELQHAMQDVSKQLASYGDLHAKLEQLQESHGYRWESFNRRLKGVEAQGFWNADAESPSSKLEHFAVAEYPDRRSHTIGEIDTQQRFKEGSQLRQSTPSVIEFDSNEYFKSHVQTREDVFGKKFDFDFDGSLHS